MRAALYPADPELDLVRPLLGTVVDVPSISVVAEPDGSYTLVNRARHTWPARLTRGATHVALLNADLEPLFVFRLTAPADGRQDVTIERGTLMEAR